MTQMKNNHKFAFIICLFLFLAQAGKAQEMPSFEKAAFELPDVKNLRMADFNKDTLMDLVTLSASAPYVLKVYENIGNDDFSEVFEFPAFENSRLQVTDLNHDNIPDLFLTGYAKTDSVAMVLLIGKEDFSFTPKTLPVNLASLNDFLWLNFDDHFLPDLLLSGVSAANGKDSVFVLLQAEDTVTVLEEGPKFSAFKNAEIIPYPEQLIFAETPVESAGLTDIYKLSGGHFSAGKSGLPALQNTITAQGDLDHDGKWDLFLYGTNSNGEEEGGIFTSVVKDMEFIPLDFEDFKPTGANITDLTNDGLADLVLHGTKEGEAIIYLLSATDDYKLTEMPFSGDYIYIADYDKDGKPEVLVLNDAQLSIYKNADGELNAPPVAPAALLGLPLREGYVFTWSHGADDKTPEKSITYDIMLSVQGEENLFRSTLINPESGLDKSFGYGALGTHKVFEWNYSGGQDFSFLLSAFDNAHHTGRTSCMIVQAGGGELITRSACVEQEDKQFYVCEPVKVNLDDFFQFNADYWVSFEKGYLGESGTDFEMAGDDLFYGIKTEGNCIDLFRARIIYGSNKESSTFDLKVCEGDSTELVSPSASLSYQWKDSEGSILGSEESLWYTPEKTGTVFLTREPLSGACPSTDTFNISVYPYPDLQMMENRTLRSGEELTLRAWGAESYIWTPAEGLSDPGGDSPVARPLKTTTYYVTGRNEPGCEAKDSVTVTVLQDLFVPSLFSPNFDGRNDRLSISGSGIKTIEFRIYDPLGKLVFEAKTTQEAQRGWDGTYNGKTLPPGNYAWQFKGSFEDGTSLSFENKTRGFITLIR